MLLGPCGVLAITLVGGKCISLPRLSTLQFFFTNRNCIGSKTMSLSTFIVTMHWNMEVEVLFIWKSRCNWNTSACASEEGEICCSVQT